MKLTRHNGRSGKHGTYNPRHNDRRFDVENSEHIDAERARQNVYWDCYRGFTTHEFRENPEQPDFSFEEIDVYKRQARDRPKQPQHRPQSFTCPCTTEQPTEQFNIFAKAEVLSLIHI